MRLLLFYNASAFRKRYYRYYMSNVYNRPINWLQQLHWLIPRLLLRSNVLHEILQKTCVTTVHGPIDAHFSIFNAVYQYNFIVFYDQDTVCFSCNVCKLIVCSLVWAISSPYVKIINRPSVSLIDEKMFVLYNWHYRLFFFTITGWKGSFLYWFWPIL